MDTRAGEREKSRALWTRGLVFLGGSVFGLMFDWEALWSALHHQSFNYGQNGPLSEVGLTVGGYILPVAVAGLAPRKSFLWAAAALGVGLVWGLMDRVAAWNGAGLLHDLTVNGNDSLLTLLILCGPICLIRLLLRRRHDGRIQRITQQEAWIQQAAEAQEGVWPPPIKRDDHR